MTDTTENTEQGAEVLSSLGNGFNFASNNFPKSKPKKDEEAAARKKEQPAKQERAKKRSTPAKPAEATKEIKGKSEFGKKRKKDRAPFSGRASTDTLDAFYTTVAELDYRVADALDEALEMWTKTKAARVEYMKEKEDELRDMEIDRLRG